MAKYILEEGVDFFEELYKSLDEQTNEHKTEEDNNFCLITNQPLTDNYVTLGCSHKFNYVALYHDIKNHKLKYNHLEGTQSKLKTNEIRCPYCRYRQCGVLPYYEELELKKINGVNFYDPSITIQNNNYGSHKSCKYKIEGETLCNHYAYFKISQFIDQYEGEDIMVCYSHKRKIIKEHNNKLKQQLKDAEKKAKQEAKEKLKEDKLKAKEAEKQAKKEEKQKLKAEKNKVDQSIISDIKITEAKKVKKSKIKKEVISVENEVLGVNVILPDSENVDIEENNGCIEILKSGSKKGSKCGCKIISNDRCKRHNKLESTDL
jgi:hypothetical protein